MSKITRRRFLTQAAAVALGAKMVPYVYSSEQPFRRKTGVERLRVGAIGTSEYRAGIWDSNKPLDGRGTFDGRRAGEFGDVVAVADLNLPFAERFAAYFPGDQCRVWQDYENILNDPTIDVVTIGTPDHWHAKIAIEAMRAGKSVYVEKPLTLTIEETRLITQTAKETGQIVQVGSQQRTENATFLRAAAICRSGRLGEKVNAVCSCPNNESIGGRGMLEDRTPFKPQPIPDRFNWDKWLGPTPKEEYCLERCFYNFRWWLAYSGGEITNWGGHNVDFAVWALNRCDVAPIEISGTGKFPNIPGWYDAAEEFDVLFRYADGATLRLKSGENAVFLEGERGRIRVNRGRLTGKPIETLTAKDEEELRAIENELMRGKASGDHMRNFFECVDDGTLPVSDVFSTAVGINMCHSANVCLRIGKTLRWNEAEYAFDDADANALISRPSRAGYEIRS